MLRALIILFISTITFGQDLVGYVSDDFGKPLDKASVFLLNKPSIKTKSDKTGYFKLNVKGFDLSDSFIVIQKNEFQEVLIPYRDFIQGMHITMTAYELEEEISWHEDVILDEAVIYSSLKVDSVQRVNYFLEKVIKHFPKNYPLHSTVYFVEGYHSLNEQVSPQKEDTLMYVKSPFHIELTSYKDDKIQLNSNIFLQPNSILFVKNQFYHVPKNSPFFLNEQVDWINFINKGFLTKRRNYIYKILEENSNEITIQFDIKQVQTNSWSGIVTIDKNDFAIVRLETNLEFNRKNSYSIVSKGASKNTTSLIYFEGAKIIWEFDKNASEEYQISKLNSTYRIIHVGVNPVFTPQFIVRSEMSFTPDIPLEESKVLALNELLFLLFHKNYQH